MLTANKVSTDLPAATKQSSKVRVIYITLGCFMILLLAGVISLGMGDMKISATNVVQSLITDSDTNQNFVIWELRMPRYVLGLLVGASLGMAGTIVQSITRNPLGSPSLLGVTSGAAFAIVASFVLFDFTTSDRLMFGTAGGFFAALLTFSIAWKTHLNPLHLTLAGISIGIFFSAGITLLLIASHTEANGIYYWLTGSLANRTWQHVDQLYLFALSGLLMGSCCSQQLNLLRLDDNISRSLGLQVHKWRLVLGIIAVTLTSATVAVAGPVAFIGLIAPHIARFSLGGTPAAMEHKVLLPLSALIGATLIAVADLLAKVQEVPVGILCILLGGPLFVHLIRKQTH